MNIIFAPEAWDDYQYWLAEQPETLARLNTLIKECTRTPFTGTGKPEPLRGNYKGWWSRRISIEHRMVYRISGKPPHEALEIMLCRYHYTR